MQGSSKLTLWIFLVWALSVVTMSARAENLERDRRSADINGELLREIDDLENINRLNRGGEDASRAGLRFDGENSRHLSLKSISSKASVRRSNPVLPQK